MRRTILATLLIAVAMGITTGAREKNSVAAGWVSDENCGAQHTKPGGADCIRKCMKGGQDIGHPEWKPQRMVFVRDADKKVWVVSNPEALKGHEGEHVRIAGRFDAAGNSLRVVEVSILSDTGEKQGH
jgi:hypothetical protein